MKLLFSAISLTLLVSCNARLPSSTERELQLEMLDEFDLAGIQFDANWASSLCPEDWQAVVVCIISDCPLFSEVCPSFSMGLDGSGTIAPTGEATEAFEEPSCQDISDSICESFTGPGNEDCCLLDCSQEFTSLTTCILLEAGGIDRSDCQAPESCSTDEMPASTSTSTVPGSCASTPEASLARQIARPCGEYSTLEACLSEDGCEWIEDSAEEGCGDCGDGMFCGTDGTCRYYSCNDWYMYGPVESTGFNETDPSDLICEDYEGPPAITFACTKYSHNYDDDSSIMSYNQRCFNINVYEGKIFSCYGMKDNTAFSDFRLSVAQSNLVCDDNSTLPVIWYENSFKEEDPWSSRYSDQTYSSAAFNSLSASGAIRAKVMNLQLF